MKIAIVVGTRPEIIKMSPIIRECEKNRDDYFILHTGQHYSYEMDKIFFEELELSQPKYYLGIGSGSQGQQTGRMIEKIEEILLKEKPDIVLAQGDTNSVLSAAMATTKLGIAFGHVEAGLRSYDRTMPEETNRVIADHVSDLLFSPTEGARKNLAKEGITHNVYVTGNPIVDAVFQNMEIADRKSGILAKLGLKKDGYILMTSHRPANVDHKEPLNNIFESARRINEKYSLPIIFPIHPRTRKKVDEFLIEVPVGMILIEPLGFLDFLKMEANARMILTDSGGVQEESCIFHVPCVTLRENTERPETITIGSNLLAGTDRKLILEAFDKMYKSDRKWDNPFGDGTSSVKMIAIIKDFLKKKNAGKR